MKGLLMNDQVYQIAVDIAAQFSQSPDVVAIALSGSYASGHGDDQSDLDLRAFCTSTPDPALRQRLITQRSQPTAHVAHPFPVFGNGEGWVEKASGMAIDLGYIDCGWITEQLDRVLVRYEASLGYTTCFWYTVQHALPLYDPQHWLADLIAKANQPYPARLRDQIIAMNTPLLRNFQYSFIDQIHRAIQRHDAPSINHRLAAFFASYFDILFAVNQQTHPGEKKLVALAEKLCPTLPEAMAPDVAEAFGAISEPEHGELLQHLNRIVDRLETWLISQHVTVAYLDA